MKKLIVLFLSLFMISTSVNAAEIPTESLPSNATFDCMEYTESLISDILDKVQNGLGFSDARAEARRRFFINFSAALLPPLTPNETTPQEPLGRYF